MIYSSTKEINHSIIGGGFDYNTTLEFFMILALI